MRTDRKDKEKELASGAATDPELSELVRNWDRELLALSELLRRLDRTGPPSIQALQERARRRRPPHPDALLDGTAPFEESRYRDEGSPLELLRTQRGVRAWHPEARHLLVFAAPGDEQASLFGQAWEERPGVGLDLTCAIERETVFFAIAARERLEPLHWALWLADARQAGELEPCSDSDLVHMAMVRVPAPLRVSCLRLRSYPMPEAHPEVSVLLDQASRAGRADDAAKAGSLYRRALAMAYTAGDKTGVVKATAGLALALMGRGYLADAERSLRLLAERQRLDSHWAGWICRILASCAYNTMDLRGAEEWVEEAERAERPPDVWTAINRAWTESAAGRHERVLGTQDAIDMQALPEATRHVLQCHRCIALAGLGQRSQAQAELETLRLKQESVLEAALFDALARHAVAVAVAGERAFDWPATVEALRPRIATKDGDVLATWDAPPLLMLAERARRDGCIESARELLRMRFLDSRSAADPEAPLLALAAVHDGLLLHGPGAGGGLHRLTLSGEEFARLTARAREELRAERSPDTCRVLGAMLFQDGALPPGELLVASDGLLTDAPLLAIAQAACDSRDDLPLLCDVAGLRRPGRRIPSPPLPAIASLADAQGDLPWACREVGRDEAAIWLRGEDARKGRLRLDRPVGLLHLGLHARREHGIPQLLFADGPMSPLEVARHRLPGHPVVLLAGCATAVACSNGGTGRSLADAFLRAGAAGVVATRWRVEDREIHPFVRALVDTWPFDDLARTVHGICLRLKRQGEPARVWAAPVVC